jgi:hypothetical protein
VNEKTFTDDVAVDFGLPWQDRYSDEKLYAEYTDAEVIGDFEGKARAESAAAEDVIQFGWTLPGWREFMAEWKDWDTHCIFGGNRSSKSVFCARLMVYLLMVIPEARLRCYHVNLEKSVSEQQAYIWDALPERFKRLPKKKGTSHSVQYSQQNGFTGGKLIIPPLPGRKRGGEMLFGTYSQYRDDPQCVEGWWAHAIWGDEEMPLKMFERLLTRLYDVRGRMVLSFTTIQGWSPLVADIIGKAQTLRKRRSDLLNREIPVAQKSLNRAKTRIYYFWTQDNPFIPHDVLEKLRGRPVEEKLAVAHGIPTKPALSKFPKFDELVHVIEHGKLPWLAALKDGEKEREFTRYHVIDPSGRKPWAMLWVAVDPLGTVYVYREWPDMGYGSWGEQSEKAEGKPGPAQKPNGYGIMDYVEKIGQLEQDEVMFERLIDPRLGAALTPTKEGATTIITELERCGLTYLPAPGVHVDHGLQLITDRLGYDTEKEVGPLNSPRLFISDQCLNLIECLKNYTGTGGEQEVWKDFIDCLRYVLENGADFVSQANLQSQGKTFSY